MAIQMTQWGVDSAVVCELSHQHWLVGHRFATVGALFCSLPVLSFSHTVLPIPVHSAMSVSQVVFDLPRSLALSTIPCITSCASEPVVLIWPNHRSFIGGNHFGFYSTYLIDNLLTKLTHLFTNSCPSTCWEHGH